MSSYTREQVAKWNAGMRNGFTFDEWYFLMRGEKNPTKKIPVNDSEYLEADICYTTEYEDHRSTGYRPSLHVSLWHLKEGRLPVSHGIGIWQGIGELQTKKTFKVLQDLTGTISDEKIIEIYNAYRAKLDSPLLVAPADRT